MDTNAQVSTKPLYLDLPKYPENEALLREAHPENWINPVADGPYDLIVIGAGPAGIVAAKTAASFKMRVALVERDLLGGDCFNVGCIPSKTLIRAARLYADMHNARDFGGVRPTGITLDFPALMARIRNVRSRTSKHVSVHRLKGSGIDIFLGTASFTGSNTLSIDGTEITFKKALIATGSRPRIPPTIEGLEEAGYLTNESVFNLTELPKSMLVIGGGPLGCEMAQAFSRLGTQVSIGQKDPMFLENSERDGAQILSNAMARDGIGIYLNARILSLRVEGSKKIVEILSDENRSVLEVDHILVSAGRLPNTESLDLSKAGIELSEGGVKIDDFLKTTNPDVYAAGDVCPDRRFDHVQDAAARAAVSNALKGTQKRLQDQITPFCIYTTPEVAHVGLYVRDAREQKIPIKTFTVLMHQVDRAIADGEEEGFVKVHVREGTDEILGATIVARNAGDIINYISMAMAAKQGLRSLAEASFPFPTQAQAIRLAALSFTGIMRMELPFKPVGKPAT